MLITKSKNKEELTHEAVYSSTIREGETYNWPGWELTINEHGDEFDALARDRMVRGGLKLSHYVRKYLPIIDTSILEVGPFFNPITKNIESSIRDKSVVYWENDPHAIRWLNEQSFLFDSKVEMYDLGREKESECQMLASNKFDAVIASQVFNYIDYSFFLRLAAKLLPCQGLIFINNVVDYGLPKLFSESRPKSIEETLRLVEISGFELVEFEIQPTEQPRAQRCDRLVLVGRKVA
jgi:hypothetical protein